MSKTVRGAALVVVLTGVVGIACGSSGGDSTFGAAGPDQLGGDGGLGSSGSSGLGGSSGASGGVGGVSPDAACATSNAGVDALPVYLVFMYDRSGSMAQNSKWTSCKAGLESFFADPSSKGLYASLAFFKQNDECNPAAYATPAVTMRALPDATSFSTRIDAISPNGGTPTLPAMQGAIQYAQSVKAGLTHGEKVAIVLVTDGDPNDCNSDPTNVAAAAATVAKDIPTYVIGVGPDAQNLNTIATGGGTAPAIMVATNNPQQITADLEKAIGQIKAAQLGCDYLLPSPPNGQKLDINAVNVDYTTGGQTQTLTYSKDCSDPNGWHYDDPNAPTKIQMCPGICSTLQGDKSGGKVDIIFGCTTQGGVTR